MGLDMFLYAKRYFWHDDTKLKEAVAAAVPHAPGEPNELRVEVLYWRKANQIHKWFVDNVQEGKDDCGHYYVTKENLAALVKVCKKVLASKSAEVAATMLPTRSGFFFGGTAYDESYFEDCEQTLAKLEPIMAQFDTYKDWSFEYHSSW